MDAALYYVCVAPGDAVREDADLVALSGQLFGEVADVSSQAEHLLRRILRSDVEKPHLFP
jgi:hypothetical protein